MEIEIWSDVVCPWCYLGMARLRRALAASPHGDAITIRWRSFELNPDAVREDTPASPEQSAARHGRSVAEVLAGRERLTALGAAEGLTYHLDRTLRVNTFDSHRLLHLANECGMQDALKERLFRAYFTESRQLGDDDTLVELATEVGIDPVRAKEVLATNEYADAVRRDEAEAHAFNITGVPFFVLDRRYGVAGAQSVEVLTQAIEEAFSSLA